MSLRWREKLTSVLAGASRVVFLGVGNEAKGDDAAGVLAVRRLRGLLPPGREGRADILLLDGGDVPESTTGPIRRFAPDWTVIIDAAVGGHPPGTVFIPARDKIADEGVSTHTISLLYLVRYLEESIGSRVVVLGIEPEDLSLGAPVSAAVSAAIDEIVEFFDGHFYK